MHEAEPVAREDMLLLDAVDGRPAYGSSRSGAGSL
jgi:hypothetical protein